MPVSVMISAPEEAVHHAFGASAYAGAAELIEATYVTYSNAAHLAMTSCWHGCGDSRNVVDAGTEVPILAPEHFLEHAVSENVYAGTAMLRRSYYYYAAIGLPKSATGTLGIGLGAGGSTGTPGRPKGQPGPAAGHLPPPEQKARRCRIPTETMRSTTWSCSCGSKWSPPSRQPAVDPPLRAGAPG